MFALAVATRFPAYGERQGSTLGTNSVAGLSGQPRLRRGGVAGRRYLSGLGGGDDCFASAGFGGGSFGDGVVLVGVMPFSPGVQPSRRGIGSFLSPICAYFPRGCFTS
jgi:hypothetical protein